MRSADLVVVVAVAAVAGGGLAALILRGLRGQGFRLRLALVAVVPVATVIAGAVAAETVGAVRIRELPPLLLVTSVGGMVAVVVALSLASELQRTAQTLGEQARELVHDDEAPPPVAPAGSLWAVSRELSQTAARLAALRDRDSRLESTRRDFVAWISHDLRAPLGGVRAIAEALKDGVAADPQTLMRYVEALQAEVDRLDELISDLFDLSRVQSATSPLDFEESSLQDTVSDAVASTDAQAAAAGVRVRCQVDEAVPTLALAPREFERALRNLLDNAIRETPRGGTVVVTAGRSGDEGVVRVSDECGGIRQEQVARLFEPGLRRRPAEGGRRSGLGLAIAAAFVHAHGGEISAVNHDRGCRFEVRVPLFRASRAR